jgi:hypothetical protein
MVLDDFEDGVNNPENYAVLREAMEFCSGHGVLECVEYLYNLHPEAANTKNYVEKLPFNCTSSRWRPSNKDNGEAEKFLLKKYLE